MKSCVTKASVYGLDQATKDKLEAELYESFKEYLDKSLYHGYQMNQGNVKAAIEKGRQMFWLDFNMAKTRVTNSYRNWFGKWIA